MNLRLEFLSFFLDKESKKKLEKTNVRSYTKRLLRHKTTNAKNNSLIVFFYFFLLLMSNEQFSKRKQLLWLKKKQ